MEVEVNEMKAHRLPPDIQQLISILKKLNIMMRSFSLIAFACMVVSDVGAVHIESMSSCVPASFVGIYKLTTTLSASKIEELKRTSFKKNIKKVEKDGKIPKSRVYLKVDDGVVQTYTETSFCPYGDGEDGECETGLKYTEEQKLSCDPPSITVGDQKLTFTIENKVAVDATWDMFEGKFTRVSPKFKLGEFCCKTDKWGETGI